MTDSTLTLDSGAEETSSDGRVTENGTCLTALCRLESLEWGCFSGTQRINISQDILDNAMLPTLQEQFSFSVPKDIVG